MLQIISKCCLTHTSSEERSYKLGFIVTCHAANSYQKPLNTQVFVTSNWHVGINRSGSCLTKTVFAFKQRAIVMLSKVSNVESAGCHINYSAQHSAPELPNVKVMHYFRKLIMFGADLKLNNTNAANQRYGH